ncbi:MAG: magnesium transporter [Haliea sp.]|jgi:magnesium transporter|nr:magnesium transporter [Haliea sp.]|tara:strand:+ start:577 stop:1932 length:1356 start_codon:yes stop_codon:yes gene_type:complete
MSSEPTAPFATLQQALERGDDQALSEGAAGLNAADLAEFVELNLEGGRGLRVFRALPAERRGIVFGYLEPDVQAELSTLLPMPALAELVTAMSSDERADFFLLMDSVRQHQLSQLLARREREDLLRLASYREGTAGALMSSEYATVGGAMSAGQAIEQLRQTAPETETIYQVYVVDAAHRLQGAVSLRNLITALPGTRVSELMASGLVQAEVETEQEEVARLIARYDLIALPIVDAEQRLVGIVTYDDAMDVAEAEATEDMHKGATVEGLDGSFRRASPFSLYRSRIQWLIILVFANLFTGAGIAHYEQTIADNLALLFFLPLLVASAGNAGAQSATLMVRALATGDVRTRDWGRLLSREVLVAAGLGLTMALAVLSVGFLRAGPGIAVVVALTMIAVVMVGSVVGMLLPFLLHRLRFDPATASTPLITTIADVSGVVIYFSMATALLGLE